jgi:histidine triad (HIT) family protein
MSFLLKIARSRLGGLLIGWLFAYMSFLIPVKRLRETGNLIAFHHPKPSYPLHILIVPKRAIKSLTSLSKADEAFVVELFPSVQSLVVEFGLEAVGYRLIANGGSYQDVPHLHFHLIADVLPNLENIS